MISWFKKVPSKHIDKSTTVGDLVWFWPRLEPEPLRVMVLEFRNKDLTVKILVKDQINYVHTSLLWLEKEDALESGPIQVINSLPLKGFLLA